MHGPVHAKKLSYALQALAAWFLLIASAALSAQNLEYLSHQSWSTAEGLPQSSVHAIAQTSDGFLWIGTEGGLVRFDGISLKVYGRESLPSEDVCCLASQADELYIGTAEGSAKEQAGEFTLDKSHFAPPSSTPGWSWSANQVVYAGTAGRNPRPPRTWVSGKDLPGRVQTILVDREGLAWVGTRNGLVVLNPINAGVSVVDALRNQPILSLFEDTEGNHWIGTETTGLHILRRLPFRREEGLANLAVTTIAQTSDDSFWVGTRDDGLRRIRHGQTDEPISVSKLSSAVILCMAPDAHGGLLVGTPDGLDLIDKENHVRMLTAADGLPDDFVRSIAVSKDGTGWIGTRHGLAKLVDGRIQKFFGLAEGLNDETIGALASSPEGLWIGTSTGLSLLGITGPGGSEKVIQSLPRTGIITALTTDRSGTLWAANSDGRLGFVSQHKFPSLHLAEPHLVYGLTADTSGGLWLRMDRGIKRFASASLAACLRVQNCTPPQPEDYGLADGLPSEEVVAGESSAGVLARNGEIWFPTRRGVTIVDPSAVLQPPVPPHVVIERFLVDDASAPDSMHLAYGPERLTFEFAGISFLAPSKVHYRYRLEGFDPDWVEGGTRRSATYTNLAPGTYRFRVQAQSSEGTWSQQTAEIALRVIPPYYRRWWFIALVLLGLLLLLLAAYRLRLRRLQNQFDAVLAERNRMAREIHDTLTQDFVGTTLQLDLLSQMLKRGRFEDAIAQVVRTRRLVTEGLNEARRSIWELRAENSADDLPTRLTRLLEKESFAELAPKLTIGGAYRPIDQRTERELLRITQEALNNIQHHANATRATVTLHYADDTLNLSIEDNGVGFVLDEGKGRAGHFGLLGMEERAETIRAHFQVLSQPGQGTEIKLAVPITAYRGKQ